MDIEVSPAAVLRCADAVETAAGQLCSGDTPSHAWNDGFTLSAAIGRFATQMQQTTTQAALDTGKTAENLDVSATLLRRVAPRARPRRRASRSWRRRRVATGRRPLHCSR